MTTRQGARCNHTRLCETAHCGLCAGLCGDETRSACGVSMWLMHAATAVQCVTRAGAWYLGWVGSPGAVRDAGRLPHPAWRRVRAHAGPPRSHASWQGGAPRCSSRQRPYSRRPCCARACPLSRRSGGVSSCPSGAIPCGSASCSQPSVAGWRACVGLCWSGAGPVWRSNARRAQQHGAARTRPQRGST